MNTILRHFQMRPDLARKANWSVANLAKVCGVSVRTLDRHFLNDLGTTPREWLADQRQVLAKELLANGRSVKETAAQVAYRHAGNFSRKFKVQWEFSPSVASSFVCRSELSLSQNDTKWRKMNTYKT